MNALPTGSIALPQGLLAVLRPVTPADAEAERDFVAGLSSSARYFRFHGAVNALTDEMAQRMTCVDQDRQVAVVATIAELGRERVIADARYVVSGDVAEFAIAVADRFRGCGLGGRLLAVLAVCARRSGLRWLVGEVLAANRPMLGLAHRLGFVRSMREVAGVVRVERALDRAVPVQRRVARALNPLARWMGVRGDPAQMFAPF